jgi:hypothetical protein
LVLDEIHALRVLGKNPNNVLIVKFQGIFEDQQHRSYKRILRRISFEGFQGKTHISLVIRVLDAEL